MIYPYRCSCGRELDIYKPAAEASAPELCECGQVMDRVYTSPYVSVVADTYNRALGCKQSQAKEAVRRINGETGRRITEVGTESLASVKPKLNRYPDPVSVLKDYYSTES